MQLHRSGFRLPLAKLRSITELSSLEESLSAVGGTAEAILGVMLLVAGIGLLRRLSFAWTLAVLLLVITLSLNIAQAKLGIGSALRVILLSALILTRGHFTRRTAMASVVFSLTNILTILAYAIIGSYMLGKGFNPEIHDLNTACYFAITSLSTVGYGDHWQLGVGRAFAEPAIHFWRANNSQLAQVGAKRMWYGPCVVSY